MVMLKHGVDMLATERRHVLAKFRTRIPPVIADHCHWPATSTNPPGKVKVGGNVENKTARVDRREGVGIVDNGDAQGTKKTLFKLRIGRILRDDR